MTSVEGLVGSLRDALARTSRSLRVDDPDFAATLRLGQIVKGRVMRHAEDGRYWMDFGGREKIVDSTLPLRVSELVTARVVAVGEQVHLQRLEAHGEAAAELAAPLREMPLPSRHEQLVQELFDRYNAALSAPEREALAQSVRRASSPELMGLTGLLLRKLGATLAPELLQALYRRLDGVRREAPAADPRAPRLLVDAGSPQARALAEAAVEALAARLRALAGDAPTPADALVGDGTFAEAGGGWAPAAGEPGGAGSDAQWLLGQWLLNAQSHPRIAQRLVRLPLWLGDRLVEVSVALFSEAGSQPAGGIRFGHAVLLLELPRLGRVQVTLRAAGRSLRAAVAAEHEESVASLARHSTKLRAALERCGFEVAELGYLQTTLSGEGAVLDAIVHHHLTPDSLSRWM